MMDPVGYLGKYAGKGTSLLLAEFKKLQQKKVLAVQKKAVKIRQENVEEVIMEDGYLVNEHKQLVAQQDDDINMEEMMKGL